MLMWTHLHQSDKAKLLSRIKEHTTSEKSEVSKHLFQHSTHPVDFNMFMILGSENDTARLLILESLLI